MPAIPPPPPGIPALPQEGRPRAPGLCSKPQLSLVRPSGNLTSRPAPIVVLDEGNAIHAADRALEQCLGVQPRPCPKTKTGPAATATGGLNRQIALMRSGWGGRPGFQAAVH